MSETIPPIGSDAPPKTSALAIWSLVLGILSLFCFSIFTAIPGVICGHKALSRIKRSSGSLAGQGLAIAGLVTGYVGILLAIVAIPMMIPASLKAREAVQKLNCIANLRQIDTAKQQWAVQNKKQPTDIPTQSDLAPYLNGRLLKCPAGGVYQINAVGEQSTCSIPKHKRE
jgi:hypothetical protein